MNGPNLSQYFTNDPPSPFDVIGGKNWIIVCSFFKYILSYYFVASVPVINVPFPTNTGPDSFIQLGSVNHEDSSMELVTDSVKDFWEPACVENGIPPILTMPGVLLATELV